MDEEGSAGVGGRVAGDCAGVELDDGMNHREAEAGSGRGAGAGTAVEAFVDAGNLLLGNADTGVGDGKPDAIVGGGKLDANGTAGGSELYRVVHKVADKPLQLRGMPFHAHGIVRQLGLEADALLLRHGGINIYGFADDCRKVERRGGLVFTAAVVARYLRVRVDNSQHQTARGHDRGGGLLAAYERMGEPVGLVVDVRYRCAQVVQHVPE